jgi:hypothetical protein
VESSLNSVFVGEELSEDARMFIRASAAENMWKKHNSAWQCVLKFSKETEPY